MAKPTHTPNSSEINCQQSEAERARQRLREIFSEMGRETVLDDIFAGLDRMRECRTAGAPYVRFAGGRFVIKDGAASTI